MDVETLYNGTYGQGGDGYDGYKYGKNGVVLMEIKWKEKKRATCGSNAKKLRIPHVNINMILMRPEKL